VIRSASGRRLSVPLPRALVSGIHNFTRLEVVVTTISTGTVEGSGYAVTFFELEADAVMAMTRRILEMTVGRSLEPLRDHHTRTLRGLNYVGRSGIAVLAMSGVETALWDAAARQVNLPLHRMLGTHRTRVPVYLSGGWLSYSLDELVTEALEAAESGFQHYKMKVGSPDWTRDVSRVEALLKALPDGMAVMVDANQGWDVKTALAAGRELQRLGVDWLEEPVDAYDLVGHRRLTDSLDMRIASGETLFMFTELRRLVEERAVDVIMPDLMRCGGPEDFLAIGAFAGAHGVEVSSHMFTEVSSQLMATLPDATLVEYIPGWFDGLLAEPLEFVDGEMVLSDTPGAGLQLSEQALSDHAVGDSFVVEAPV
jgi:L-alanine-DL-glutamate epimerase-like enolase superfamily enzyme